VPDVLAWYQLEPGDSGEYVGSQEAQDWVTWHTTSHAPQASPTPVAGN